MLPAPADRSPPSWTASGGVPGCCGVSGCTSQSRAAAVVVSVVSQVRVMSPNFLNPLAIWWTLACSHQETCDRRLLGHLRILVVDSSIGQVRVFALALVSFRLREGLVAAERELTISRRILGYAANVRERLGSSLPSCLRTATQAQTD